MFLSRRAGTQHHNTVRGVTFPSHAWGIRPITTHWIAGQSEHASLLRTMSFVKIEAFQKAGHRGATIMYSMWKIMCFLNLKPHKHIALHQIRQIMLFLATSYDSFNRDAQYWILADIRYADIFHLILADSRYRYISFCLETFPVHKL